MTLDANYVHYNPKTLFIDHLIQRPDFDPPQRVEIDGKRFIAATVPLNPLEVNGQHFSLCAHVLASSVSNIRTTFHLKSLDGSKIDMKKIPESDLENVIRDIFNSRLGKSAT